MKKLLTGFLLMLSASAFAEWKVQKAHYILESALDVRNGRHYNDPSDRDGAKLRFHDKLELLGRIVINEYDESTISYRETIIENVYAVIEAYGLTLSLKAIKWDHKFPLKGLKGKPISALFDNGFYGGRINLGAGFVLSANPNIDLMFNSRGIWIPNIETLININFNLNLEMAYLKLSFRTRSLAEGSKSIRRSATISVQTTSPATTEKLNIKDMKSIVVGQ